MSKEEETRIDDGRETKILQRKRKERRILHLNTQSRHSGKTWGKEAVPAAVKTTQ